MFGEESQQVDYVLFLIASAIISTSTVRPHLGQNRTSSLATPLWDRILSIGMVGRASLFLSD